MRGGYVRRKISLSLAVMGLAWAVPGYSATCTLPVTLTNGTLADATQVMSDLNAAAICAGAAVTPSGAPTAGSIAVFSSPTAIGPGNLSGDLTTSGGTTTILSSTGVVPGSYSNSNVTVDVKGRVTAVSSGSASGTNIIFTKTADGTSGTIVISNIPQNYQDLILVISGQSTNSVQDLNCFANNDLTAADYRNNTWNQFGTGAVALPRIGTFPGLNIPSSGSAARIVTEFLSYSSTTWMKNAMSQNEYEDSPNFFRSLLEWKWINTASINSLTLTVASGNFASGTTISLYGRGLAS
jgi:hypothetical protein